MKTEEGNKIIAEFMDMPIGKRSGLYIPNPINQFEFPSGVEALRYHKSWDWLMPACRKWDEIKVSSKEAGKYIELCDELDHLVTLYEITPVYKQLVKNIKWYNENNKAK